MAVAPERKMDLSLDEIESQIAALSLLKSQRLAEAEAKKSKKDKKAGKVDVKVPKVRYPSEQF
jgi:hypothetical protein